MAKSFLLMCADTPVMSINTHDGKYDILNENLVPYALKNRFIKRPDFSGKDIDEIIKISINIASKNYNTLIGWLGNRTLLLSRSNAKKLYNLFDFDQLDTPEQRAKIALVCRAVSLLDNYWLKLEGDDTSWNEVNIRRNSLNEIVTQVALHGTSATLQGSLITPELTTNGVFAKAWRRHSDGSLWLYKRGFNTDTASQIEVMCSNLLDKMNVEHVHYEAGTDNGKYVCMCPCMSTDDVSILSARDFLRYCASTGKKFFDEVVRIDAESFFKMWIVDYLISNPDRHFYNWGFYCKSDTMEILKCHPLFDHNNAFDVETMANPNFKSKSSKASLKKSAHFAMSKVDFHFTEKITRNDFMTDAQYNSFMLRANELGIKVVKEQPKDNWAKYCEHYHIVNQQVEKDRLMELYGTTDMMELNQHLEEDFL